MSVYAFYDILLEKLGVKNYSRTSELLYTEDFNFFMNYRKKNKHIMKGGGDNHFYYMFKDYKFKIFYYSDKDRYTFSIHNNDNEDDSTCLLLFIPMKENYVYVHTISVHEKCVSNNISKTKIGTLLFQCMLDFIDNKLKNKFKLKYIQIKDNSQFYCKVTKKNINFSSLYMLSRGETWYGKYGFKPFDDNELTIHKRNYKNYKKNQKIVENTKIKDTNIGKYMKDAIKEKPEINFGLTNDKIDKFMERFKNKSVRKFFYALTKLYDQSCGLISEIYEDVMDDLGMTNLQGITYYRVVLYV